MAGRLTRPADFADNMQKQSVFQSRLLPWLKGAPLGLPVVPEV